MTRKDATHRMGYVRIEQVTGGTASSATLRRAGYRAAYDAGMPDARVEPSSRGERMARGIPPTPQALGKQWKRSLRVAQK